MAPVSPRQGHGTRFAARRTRLHELEAEVRARNADLARDLWRMGDALREIQYAELWRDDHDSFESWLASFAVTGRSTAYKAMRVAEVFGEEMAVRFGTEKLDAAVTYLSATAKDEEPGDVLALHPRVRGSKGTWTTVPFLQASRVQIRTATSLLSQSKRGAGLPGDLRTRVERFNREVPTARRVFRGAKAHVKRRKDGKVVVAVSGVPLELFAEYAAEVVRRLTEG